MSHEIVTPSSFSTQIRAELTDRKAEDAPSSRTLSIPMEDAKPIRLAQLFLAQSTTEIGTPTIVRWAGRWWQMREGFYRDSHNEELRAAIQVGNCASSSSSSSRASR
jgi:hypothetical protein